MKMALSLIILKQIILMFIYMTIGFLLYKKKFVTKQGSQELGMILLSMFLSRAAFGRKYPIEHFSGAFSNARFMAIFAQINNMDYTQAVKDICLSTVLCIATIPAVISAAEMILCL